jgi:hypothetical protein
MSNAMTIASTANGLVSDVQVVDVARESRHAARATDLAGRASP